MTHRSDTGPFALVPVWVLDLPISHLALRVYAIHADWADRGGANFHGRKAIADRLGVSVDRIDEAHRSLVAHGALRVEHRRDAQGDPTTNRYVVCRLPPGVAANMRLPSRTDAATGSRKNAALTRSKALEDLNQSDAPQEKPLGKAELLERVRVLRRREESSCDPDPSEPVSTAEPSTGTDTPAAPSA